MGLIDLGILDQYWWRLLQGLWMTIEVVGLSCSLGFLLAYPLALARRSSNILISAPALSFMTCFRGTPLLCQLYLVYYGAGEIRPLLTSIGLWWFFRQAFYCCILAFTLNTCCYQAEVMRGALSGVPKGQVEAARALGLPRYRIARHVVFPQALLLALRPLGNELISMVKASALAAIVTLLDLMGQTRFIFARTFDFSIYFYAALLYLVVTEAISRVILALERMLSRHIHAHLPVAAAAQATDSRKVAAGVATAMVQSH